MIDSLLARISPASVIWCGRSRQSAKTIVGDDAARYSRLLLGLERNRENIFQKKITAGQNYYANLCIFVCCMSFYFISLCSPRLDFKEHYFEGEEWEKKRENEKKERDREERKKEGRTKRGKKRGGKRKRGH